MTNYKLTPKGEKQTRLVFRGNTYIIAEITDAEIEEIYEFGGKAYFEKIETPNPKPAQAVAKTAEKTIV
jgi:hypothetical protein